MINHLSRMDLRAKALLINAAVSLLIVALFATLLLSHQQQLEENIRHQSLRLSSSLLEAFQRKQADADNQLELLRDNEAVMDRLFQAELENNATTLPLPETLLQQLHHDVFRLFDADGAVIARYGRAGDIIPPPLRKKSLRGFLRIDKGLLFVVQAPVIYGKQIMGYVALGNLLDKKALRSLLHGQPQFAGIQLFIGHTKLLATAGNYDSAQAINIGQDFSGQPVTFTAGLDPHAILSNSHQFFIWLALGLMVVILAWWLLYRHLIGDIVLRLYNTQKKLERLQSGDVYPAPDHIADAIDQVEHGLHKMSERLQLKSKKLQMERQTLLDITNAAPIWIWKTDEYGYFIFMNPAMRDVLQVENVAYSKLCDVLQLDSAEDQFAMLIDKDSDALRKVMIGDKAHDMRIIIKTHQGRGARGNTGLALDMTEHLRLQALTYQQQKLESLGTLVGGVAHNFNNMLAGMKGYAFLAKNKISEQADAVQQLDKLDAVLTDAAEMVKQLLAFVHKGMDSKQHVELNEIIQNTYAITQLSMPANIRFDAQISNEKMTVYGNASALQQVFVNLVVNARDAVESADSKKVITTRLERMSVDTNMQQTHPDLQVSFVACLSVEDNGCGIKPEHLKYIFEPFFTNKEVGQGTGLGLSMSIGTVESYGGWIDIDSTLGKGSVFRIFLPLTEKTRHKQ